jgi:hypothetical protein
MADGGCHCGAIRYSLAGEPKHSSVCHCGSCRRTTGGLQTAWLGYPTEALTVERGEPRSYNSSGGVQRQFCGACGTSLFYTNEPAMPGIVDVLTVTLDDPLAFPPALHVQMADALPWEATLEGLPKFNRYPGAG